MKTEYTSTSDAIFIPLQIEKKFWSYYWNTTKDLSSTESQVGNTLAEHAVIQLFL